MRSGNPWRAGQTRLDPRRNGLNLLRLILNSHSRIAVPHPPHIVRYFAPLEPLYGELAQDGPFRALVADILRLLDTHIYQWDVPIDTERVVREATPRTAFRRSARAAPTAACRTRKTWPGSSGWCWPARRPKR